eukprot:scaffold28969_cov40-Prasinocladus_malaysianus.AAC.2
MGNKHMLRQLAEAVTGHVDSIEDSIVSNIDDIADSIPIPGYPARRLDNSSATDDVAPPDPEEEKLPDVKRDEL